jgi:hypothetical protein
MDGANEQKVVNLVGTEVWGVQREGQIATSVSYSDGQKIEPSTGDINCSVYDATEMVTDMVCRLSALLEKLRKLEPLALAGDEAAVATAELLSFPESLFSHDDIDELEYSVDELTKLTSARIEQRPGVTVRGDQIDATVRDLALPFLNPDDGQYAVTVRTYHYRRSGEVKDARIEFTRTGRYVDINVIPTFVPPAMPMDATVETLYKRVVEANGEAAASVILNAVQHIAKGNPAKQAELLWKVVSA